MKKSSTKCCELQRLRRHPRAAACCPYAPARPAASHQISARRYPRVPLSHRQRQRPRRQQRWRRCAWCGEEAPRQQHQSNWRSPPLPLPLLLPLRRRTRCHLPPQQQQRRVRHEDVQRVWSQRVGVPTPRPLSVPSWQGRRPGRTMLRTMRSIQLARNASSSHSQAYRLIVRALHTQLVCAEPPSHQKRYRHTSNQFQRLQCCKQAPVTHVPRRSSSQNANECRHYSAHLSQFRAHGWNLNEIL
jgi:hypothetical protein